MVISAGTTSPVIVFVASLNCLQNSAILTPCCPRAGPIGGAGFALPASICNLRIVLMGFAMLREIMQNYEFMRMPLISFAVFAYLSIISIILLDFPYL